MLISGFFNYSWYYIINRKLTTIHNLKYDLASFITIQAVIFISIYKTSIDNLQCRRI